MLYLGLVTLIINDWQNQDTTFDFSSIDSYISTKEFTSFTDVNMSLADANVNQIEGSWNINIERGIYPTALKTLNYLYLVGLEPKYVRGTVQFGSVESSNQSWTEQFNVNGLNSGVTPENQNPYMRILMADLMGNILSNNVKWYLTVDGNSIYIQANAISNLGVDNWYTIQNPVGTFYDNAGYGQDFTYAYDTGFRLSPYTNNFTIGYYIRVYTTSNAIVFSKSNRADIEIYINGQTIYKQNIPIYRDFAISDSLVQSYDRVSEIQTNSLDISILSNYKSISQKQIKNDFDVWGFIDTIASICTFNVDENLVPKFLQFILFGIYDLAILYIIARLLSIGGG